MQNLKDAFHASLMSNIVLRVILDKFLVMLIDGVIGKVHVDIIGIGLLGLLVQLSTESC